MWDWTVRDSMKRRSASEGMRTAAPILTKSIARAAISESIVRMLRDVAAAASFLVRCFRVVIVCNPLTRLAVAVDFAVHRELHYLP